MDEARPAREWIVRIQIVEYLRAFLLGPSGWSRFRAVMLISGAVAMYRRDILVEIGGYDPECVGEDFEVVMRIHRHMVEHRRDYSVHLVADQVSWKEVPSAVNGLHTQRKRWHRGLAESLWKHRGMLFRPEYGRFGMVVLPYYWAFELISPLLELMALVLVVLGFALGVVSAPYLLLFLAVVYGYGTVVTLVSLAVEEVTFHEYTRWRDLGAIVLAAVLESFGYRQLTAWWRVQGLLGRQTGQAWATTARQGPEGGPTAVRGLKGEMALAAPKGDPAATASDGHD
jgi:cellulose synthase/poly-beta-1,6-N-acetylglucosamine synthase-like glycosyltransferase